VWHALHGRHQHFARGTGDACRYPVDVAPLAAVASPTVEALKQLSSLLAPGESTWLIGESFPPAPELRFEGMLVCFQMMLPQEIAPPDPSPEIVKLSDAGEMVALTDVAFPGFFRARTCEMGSYYGVRAEGELIAMGGERIMLDGYAEISGVCTRPEHRGKGLAAGIIWRLVRDHRREGLVSWLHVVRENRNAVELYLRMGFTVVREVTLHRVARVGA
jgi:GNAT superfamily N-acetyltransferase